MFDVTAIHLGFSEELLVLCYLLYLVVQPTELYRYGSAPPASASELSEHFITLVLEELDLLITA